MESKATSSSVKKALNAINKLTINGQEIPVKKVALITGVDGQDGSYLAELLLSKGYRVCGIVRSTNTKRISRLSVEKYTGDICDSSFMRYVLNKVKPHEIYNLAALSQVGNSFVCPIQTNEVNYIGTLNILSSLLDLGMIETTKFYQASTSEMFGSNYTVEKIDGQLYKVQNEKTPLSPNSPYGLSKLAAHNAVAYFRRAHKLQAACGILHNHESPRRGDTFVTKKICRFIGALQNYDPFKTGTSIFDGTDVQVDQLFNGDVFPAIKLKLGNLDAYRDWSHAKDMVKAMHLMLQQPKEKLLTNQADYVVSSNETHNVAEFAELSFSLVQKIHSDYITVDDSFKRPYEVPYLRGDSRRIRAELGWYPEVTFKDLVKEMVDYELEAHSRHARS